MLATHTLALTAALLAAPSLLAQSTITGRLHATDTGGATPLHHCPVFAQSIDDGPLVAEYPDAEGRFTLTFPPADRVSIGILCDDYLLVSINDGQPPIATFDCSEPGLCTNIRLNLERLGSIEGYVVDPLGNPLQNLQLGLRSFNSRRRSRGRPTRSDDRGYFRFYHLPPGEYEIMPLESSALREGVNWTGDSQRVTLAPGESQSGLQVAMRLTDGVPVRGRALGLPPATTGVRLRLTAIDERYRRTVNRNVQVDEQGRFQLPEVPRGRYRAVLIVDSTEDPNAATRIWRTGVVDVDGSGAEIVLQPFEPATLGGEIELVRPDRDDLPFATDGATIYMVLDPADGSEQQSLRARPPDYSFEQTGLPPGEYNFRFSGLGPSPRADYLTPSETWEPLETLTLEPGETQALHIRLRTEIGRLTVLVKPPKNAPDQENPTHYIVGLRRDDVRLFPTDQYGRLQIDYFAWGEYEICAWSGISLDEARARKTWEAAGGAVLPFEHGDGVDMEITLNAAP